MAQERINFEVFDDLIVKWRHYVRKNDPTGTWEGKQLAQATSTAQSLTGRMFDTSSAAAPSSFPTETKPTIKGESSNSSLTL